jgi:phosphate/sulfate permease
MSTLSYRFWLALALVGGMTGATVTLGSGASTVENVIFIAIAAAVLPVGAFLAGAVFFTVREERRDFCERHHGGRD